MTRVLNIQRQEERGMHTYAWTFNVKNVMTKTDDLKPNGKPRYRQMYVLNEVFPKVLSGVEIRKVWSGGEPGKGKLSREIIGSNGEEEAIKKVWQLAKTEVLRLLSAGKNLMAVVVCVEKDEYGFSLCSAYEEKFDLRRGVDMARGRLLKALKKAGKYDGQNCSPSEVEAKAFIPWVGASMRLNTSKEKNDG